MRKRFGLLVSALTLAAAILAPAVAAARKAADVVINAWVRN